MNNITDKRNQRRAGFYFEETGPKISVTHVLTIIEKPQLKYWFGEQVYYAVVVDPSINKQEALSAPYRTSKEAALRGSTVHSIIEAWKTTGDRIKDIPSQFSGYADAFYKWAEEVKLEVIENEKTVVSEKYQYAGTLDMLGKIGGRTYVIDFKTNKDGNVYDEVSLQLSAYKQALFEQDIKVDGLMAVAVSPTGTYTAKVMNDNLDVFLSALKLWVWKNKDVCEKVGYKGGESL
jgi:hypothetical protein